MPRFVAKQTSHSPEPWESGFAWRKCAPQILRGCFLLASVAYVGRELWLRLREMDWPAVEVSWPLVILSLLASALGSGLPLVSARFILRSFSPQVPPWLPMASAVWLPALGKYVPGKIATFLGSFLMLRKLHVEPMAAALTAFLLNGLAVLVGIILAAPLTFWQPLRERLPLAAPASLVVALIGTICLHPKIVGAVGNFFLSRLKKGTATFVPSWNNHTVPLAVLVVQYSFQGISLWLLARAFGPISVTWLPAFIAINALAISIGFLAFFAPGGFGVREGILLLVLSPATGGAALIVVAMRVVSLLGELLLAALGAAILFSPIWRAACRESVQAAESHSASPVSSELDSPSLGRAA